MTSGDVRDEATKVSTRSLASSSSIRVLDLSNHIVPDAYAHIIVANTKTRIVIRNRQQPPESSSALKQNLIVESLCAHFRDETRFKRIKPYLLDTSGVSMRLLDWMVTNYAKQKKLVIPFPHTCVPSTTQAATQEEEAPGCLTPQPNACPAVPTSVWHSYRNFLRSYSKRNFDPFCRRTRLMVTFDADVDKLTYVTTAAKLNFLRWALDTGVLDYCETNISTIEKAMIDSLRVDVSGACRKRKKHAESPDAVSSARSKASRTFVQPQGHGAHIVHGS